MQHGKLWMAHVSSKLYRGASVRARGTKVHLKSQVTAATLVQGGGSVSDYRYFAGTCTPLTAADSPALRTALCFWRLGWATPPPRPCPSADERARWTLSGLPTPPRMQKLLSRLARRMHIWHIISAA